MSNIKLKPDLLEMARSGNKKATTRLGIKSNIDLGYCELFDPADPKNRIKDLEVYKMEVMAFCDLSDEIARLEGYRSVEELREALLSIYRTIDDYSAVTVIYFQPLEYERQ